jgi:hypothetical protein
MNLNQDFIRLNIVLKELNVSMDRAIDFLNENGINYESNPYVYISKSSYDLLKNQFEIGLTGKRTKNSLGKIKIETAKSIYDKYLQLDLYSNLDDSTYNNIINILNSDVENKQNIHILIKTEDGNHVREQSIKSNDFSGSYSTFRKIANSQTLSYQNENFIFSIGQYEVRFTGSKLPLLTKRIIGSILYEFRVSATYRSLKIVDKKILEKDLDKVISQLNLMQCFFILFCFQEIKKHKVNSIKNRFKIKYENIGNFNQFNPDENDILNVIKNKFQTGKTVIKIMFNKEEIDSEFTDFQAFHICKGLKGKAYLYKKYIQRRHNDEDIYFAHLYATKISKEKGRDFVNFIFTLPSLPFRCPNFKILFNILDKNIIENNNPLVRIKIKNFENKNEDIEYGFLIEDNTKYINQIRVVNKTTKNVLFDVNREGVILPVNLNKKVDKENNCTPVLQFFYQITENEHGLKEAIISYGIETGKCSLCGRKLTDTISKMKGIGPVCEQHI